MNGNEGFWGEGMFGLILFLIVAGVFSGNGGIFGGNRATDQVTNDFLFNNLANQNREIMSGINTTDRDVLTTSCNTDKSILESRFTTEMGFNNLTSALQNCCCDLKTAIHSEGEMTRSLIQSNTIQDLRDRLSASQRETDTANLALQNNAQTQTILTNLGRYVTNPYVPYSYGYYGCGTGCNC